MSGARIAGLCSLALSLSITASAGGESMAAFYGALADGDKVFARASLQDALETLTSRHAAEWRNDASGTSGTITPLRTFRIQSGSFCREFRETVKTAAAIAERTGTACRRGDGIWIIVDR